jgi:hypothetical protein
MSNKQQTTRTQKSKESDRPFEERSKENHLSNSRRGDTTRVKSENRKSNENNNTVRKKRWG